MIQKIEKNLINLDKFHDSGRKKMIDVNDVVAELFKFMIK